MLKVSEPTVERDHYEIQQNTKIKRFARKTKKGFFGKVKAGAKNAASKIPGFIPDFVENAFRNQPVGAKVELHNGIIYMKTANGIKRL